MENIIYYSTNGINEHYPLVGFIGGREFDDIGVGPFESPEAFFKSFYNRAGEKDDVSSNHYGFSEGFQIPTTKEHRTEYRYDDLGRPVAVKRYGASGSSYRYDAGLSG